MRKILTFLFAALMSVGMWAAPIVVEKVQIGDLYYNLRNDNQTAEVIKYQSGNKYTGDIIIPESVEYYSVTYTVTSIGYEAFYGCDGLTSVTIGNSVTSIGDVAFESCTGLTSVTIGNSVTSIGGQAFSQCASLTSITIPNSVTSIGQMAFALCISLASIEIPNSVTSIGAGAFAACTSLTSMVVASGNTTYDSRDNCNAIIETSSNTLIAGCPNTIIPNGVTSIEVGAFYYCYGLTSITIPNSVTSIGQMAFESCSDLTSVTIGNSVISIGESAFYACEGLTSITCHAVMPPTCGDDVFYEVDKSIPLYVPSGSVAAYQAADQWEDFTNIQAIADEPANSCGDGLTWEYNSTTNALTISYDGSGTGVMDDYDQNPAPWDSSKGSITSVIIPNGVTHIGSAAFLECTGLTSITIPNSVTSIGSSAFNGCFGLTSITIPNSVTSIGIYAFNGCAGLTSVTIGNSVTSIGEGAFFGCDGLTSIEIPNSVISIGNQAFMGCSGLTSVTIGNSVTSIGMAAFAMCSSLASIEIPNSVISIGDWAFYGCDGLASFTINASTPPTLGSDAFEGTAEGLKIYVPAGSVDTYKAAENWSAYAGQIEAIAGGEPAEDVDITPNADPQHASVYYSTFFDSSVKYELPAGVEAYVADLSGANLLLTKIAEAGEVIPANVAVILKSTVTPFTLTVSDADAVTFTATNDLQGSDTQIATPANCYVLAGTDGVVGFYHYTASQLNAHKAYVVYSGSNQAPRRMPFIFDQATGVENVQGNVQSTKVIENGVLYIIKNGVKYNAQGQIVK